MLYLQTCYALEKSNLSFRLVKCGWACEVLLAFNYGSCTTNYDCFLKVCYSKVFKITILQGCSISLSLDHLCCVWYLFKNCCCIKWGVQATTASCTPMERVILTGCVSLHAFCSFHGQLFLENEDYYWKLSIWLYSPKYILIYAIKNSGKINKCCK